MWRCFTTVSISTTLWDAEVADNQGKEEWKARGIKGQWTLCNNLSCTSDIRKNLICSWSRQLCFSQEQRSHIHSGLINVDKAFQNWSGEWAACSKVIKLACSSCAVLFEDGLWWRLQHRVQDSSGDPFSHSTLDRFIFLSFFLPLAPLWSVRINTACCWAPTYSEIKVSILFFGEERSLCSWIFFFFLQDKEWGSPF